MGFYVILILDDEYEKETNNNYGSDWHSTR